MSDSWRMEPTARPTHQIDRKNRFIANAWKCQTHYATADPEIISENWVPVEWEINFENWVMGWQMELTANNNSRFTYEINRENRFIIDAWNRLWKLRHYWPEIVSENIVAVALNRNWNLSDSWCMESTARPTHQIDRKNRFMAIAWNCQTHYANTDSEIVNENWFTVEREINFENWVTADGWNRQRILIHDWCMKSIKKTESSLTHGIVSGLPFEDA